MNNNTNAQGDVYKILGGSGSVSACYTYDAWGNIISVKNGSGVEITNPEAIGLQNSIRYRSYVYDKETNLYYLQSRYYDPETGRFINCDAPEYIGANDTFDGWNGFAYCENEPVDYVDTKGNIRVKISIYYISKFFITKTKRNTFLYSFIAYSTTDENEIRRGENYHSALLEVSRNNVAITICFSKKVVNNKKYIKGFVENGLFDDLSSFVLESYFQSYSQSYSKRTKNGIQLELLVHMYAYYFDLDKNENYKHTKTIDIDNSKNGNGLKFERALIRNSSFVSEKMCINAIKKNKENKIITHIVKKFMN